MSDVTTATSAAAARGRTKSSASHLGLLIGRLALGGVLIAHGAQKLFDFGVAGTAANFEAMGIPLHTAAAIFAIVAELGGGILVVLGSFLRTAAVLVTATMAGAFWFVHRGNGIFAADGGWELVALIAVFAITLAATGPGRWALSRRK